MHRQTSYATVRAKIRPGDIALFRRASSWVAIWQGDSDYSHVAMVDHNRGVVVLMEFREWIGSRTVTLSSQVRKFPGSIDIYRPRCSEAAIDRVLSVFVRQLGEPYGWWIIVGIALSRLPFIRWLVRLWTDPDDMTPSGWHTPKECAQAIVWCFRTALGNLIPNADGVMECADPVPGLNDRLVTPSHLAHSGLFQLMFPGLIHTDEWFEEPEVVAKAVAI